MSKTIARALDAAPPSPAASRWRPIETAPKDGTPIWVYCPYSYQCSVVWSEIDSGWSPDLLGNRILFPTHWTPLLDPPEVES